MVAATLEWARCFTKWLLQKASCLDRWVEYWCVCPVFNIYLECSYSEHLIDFWLKSKIISSTTIVYIWVFWCLCLSWAYYLLEIWIQRMYTATFLARYEWTFFIVNTGTKMPVMHKAPLYRAGKKYECQTCLLKFVSVPITCWPWTSVSQLQLVARKKNVVLERIWLSHHFKVA